MVTIVVGVFGPTANGDRFALFQILDATLASTLIVIALIALTSTRLPWRRLLGEERELLGATTPVVVRPTVTAAPAAVADAYADSS